MSVALKYWSLEAQSFLKLLCAVIWTIMLNLLSSKAHCCTLRERRKRFLLCSDLFIFSIFGNVLPLKNFYFNLQLYWNVFEGTKFKDWIQKELDLIKNINHGCFEPTASVVQEITRCLRCRWMKGESPLQTSLVCAESITAITWKLEENNLIQLPLHSCMKKWLLNAIQNTCKQSSFVKLIAKKNYWLQKIGGKKFCVCATYLQPQRHFQLP